MADKTPILHSLQKPTDVHEMLREERRQEDCLGCRVVGSAAFFGLAGYGYISGMSQLEKQREAILKSKLMFGIGSRKFGVAAISMGLVWMGVLRAFK